MNNKRYQYTGPIYIKGIRLGKELIKPLLWSDAEVARRIKANPRIGKYFVKTPISKSDAKQLD